MRKHTDMARDICNEVLGRIKTTCEGSKGFPAPLDVRSLLNSSAIKGLGKAETKKRRQALARILYKLVQMGFLEGVDKGTGESVQDIVDLAIVDKQTKLANPDKYEYDIPRNLGKVLNDRDHFDLISQIIVGDVDLDFFGKYVERLEKEAHTRVYPLGTSRRGDGAGDARYQTIGCVVCLRYIRKGFPRVCPTPLEPIPKISMSGNGRVYTVSECEAAKEPKIDRRPVKSRCSACVSTGAVRRHSVCAAWPVSFFRNKNPYQGARMPFVPNIIEKENDGRYSTDLLSRLAMDRIVFVHEPITSQLAMIVNAQLLYMDALSDEPIQLYISSPGGEVMAGLSILDIMTSLRSPVHTVALGMVASMASILLVHGDRRYMLPNAQVMLHQPLGGAQGQASDIEITAQQIIKIKKKLNAMLADKTGQPLEKIERVTDRDSYFDAEESLAFGLVDEILWPEEKKVAA